MKVKELVKDLEDIQTFGDLNKTVGGICQDSREFKENDLFVAIRGQKYDGHKFLDLASKRGASALVVEEKGLIPQTYKGAVIVHENPRSLLSVLAARYYSFPSRNVYLAGVTGTNGKTTTTYMIEALLQCGVIGTIDIHHNDKSWPTLHTTPDALALQKIFSEWDKEGVKAVAMEVSSHALAQGRVDNLDFDAAVFTNITRDHLDFHGSMEEYIDAKAKLFRQCLRDSTKKDKMAIINGEDPSSEAIKPLDLPVWTYGLSSGDFNVLSMNLSFEGTQMDIQSPKGLLKTHVSMVGRHNVYNALSAVAVGVHYGLTPQVIADRLSHFHGVPGRLERVPTATGLRVFVDYAHTDDGLIQVLKFLKDMRDTLSPQSKIITVFGCGGDRDRGKRPLMMKAAMEGSDVVVVTSDNPRRENPEAIIRDILSKTTPAQKKKFTVDADRREAIKLAVGKANKGDVILIAGKGHEKYQILGEQKIPFDDVQVAKEVLGQ